MIKIIALLILIVGLGAGLYLIQHPQIFKPKAYDDAGDSLGAPIPYKLEKGFAIDTINYDQSNPNNIPGIPSAQIFTLLQPDWVRFVYIAANGIPAAIPNGVKILVVFNSQVNPTVANAVPRNSTNFIDWKNYTDGPFISALDDFLKTGQRVDAIEVWNEEDISGYDASIYIPPDAYAYMLQQSAEKIKSYGRNIQVIVGGLGSGQYSYIDSMKTADPNIFTEVDAVGIHPYDHSPDGWCECGSGSKQCTTNPPAQKCGNNTLTQGDLSDEINQYKLETGLPVWVTEVGKAANSETWQAEYFKRIFQVFSNDQVPVAIWYDWSDQMLPTGFGLVNNQGAIKAVGIEFKHYI